ncbi:DNA sulfur modification protein DndE [Geothermobacter hydrogeniphilus]|uniref:DNA sulfur modification protein DndE n=1 Tax=Geothermobacter hydrogeniphilus TaxID=1969733 RepID=A0A2K2H674_9BACT|nr:DNA sulfur modification protein DndE [Geothermobacter hydrogeniphilus]PNU18826.1 DNA sulfur modification protein DndE [Geothermobacter hydrogeniphilus]
MIIETVYLSQKEKDQLIKIKRTTGIKNWNILCRWALCLSLRDKTQPPAVEVTGDHAIEMTWKVFGGQDHEIYLALLKERCKNDKALLNKESITQQLRAHLNRGILHLSATKNLNKIIEKLDLP